ncbi:uncharacterized protein TRAVEDRAFT_71885 [Trametes versicolor FP-101664 SS1]|uniref:uncharacterized protein n=1 Tax=Trametes versicolor (strain FP-101664) TaxID=717944 RepID=UPI00046225D2|nr:uncharacterized protein TRAVEDRAFT_71885 [Trametes versicolor FP-101664 SS1]EIW58216.1 hypothetical protein TRAVEDRAFT_71885 [Trametes versicolor FP-101664 SS1]
MTGTLALMLPVPPTGLPCEPAAPQPNIRPSIKARPTGPRQPRTPSDLNDIRLRRASAAVACPPSKHSLQTPGVLPKPRRHSTRVSSAPSSTSAFSLGDHLSLVSNTPSSLVMTTTTTTTTMTLSPPARLRVSESSPPFLLQQRHGPPSYFLHHSPTAISRNGPSTPPPRQKRTFSIGTSVSERPSRTTSTSPPPPAQLADTDKVHVSATASAPAEPAPPARVVTSASQRSLPNMSPPPDKALPPIPFPSRSPSPVADASLRSRSLLLPLSQSKATRPISQDAEDTIRQLEQLAAELKQMGSGALAVANERRTREPSRRRIREAPAKSAGSGVPKASLSVPRIVVTNPSMENLARGPESETPSVRSPDSDDGSGDVTEEELWVEQYGGWGTSEKGKWKASAPDEDAGAQASTSSPHATPSSGRSTPAAAKPAEMFYIYEPIGAPEFLAGSSTSPIARATAGFHSRRPVSVLKHHSQNQSLNPPNRPRRRRPAALVLATPEQAEWFGDVVLGSAPLLSRAPQHRTHLPLAVLEPGSARSLPVLSPPSSPRLSPRRAVSSDAADASSSTSSHDGAAGLLARRSEQLAQMPRMSSTSTLRDRDEGGQERPSASWASSASLGPGTSSEPNSPRHGSRPRLKSFKGLFKHFSK